MDSFGGRRMAQALVVFALWSAAAGAPAVERVVADPLFERWETFGKADGLPSDKVFAVLAAHGSVWAGTDEGLAALDRSEGTVETFDRGDGLPFSVVTTLACTTVNTDQMLVISSSSVSSTCLASPSLVLEVTSINTLVLLSLSLVRALLVMGGKEMTESPDIMQG